VLIHHDSPDWRRIEWKLAERKPGTGHQRPGSWNGSSGDVFERLAVQLSPIQTRDENFSLKHSPNGRLRALDTESPRGKGAPELRKLPMEFAGGWRVGERASEWVVDVMRCDGMEWKGGICGTFSPWHGNDRGR
jgi:hypothetical protein